MAGIQLTEIKMRANTTGSNAAVNDSFDSSHLPGGNRIDVAQLFQEHYRHLLLFVQRYLRNPEDAEDVVQSTFFEAIRCADNFSGLSKPSTWLFGIALNLAHNQVRRNCSSLMESADETWLEQIPDFNSDPANLIEQSELIFRVSELLDTLPPDIRHTFESVLVDECSYAEAAEQMRVPTGTVRSRVSRVRSSIREHFCLGGEEQFFASPELA